MVCKQRFTLSNLALLVFLNSFGLSAQADEFPIDFEVYADARVSIASGEPSWFDDWLGKGRFGGKLDGSSRTQAHLSEVSLLAKANITWDLKGFVHLKYDPEQDEAVDLVEAFVKYQPAPKSQIRYTLKAGLFFPHISRENVDIAWTTPYTITPSAINSWVGEEVRALGLEGKATYRGEDSKVSLTAAIFGFNDPAGTLLAFRGWGLGDAKVGAFGELPLPPIPSIGEDSAFLNQALFVNPVREIDNRPGVYAAIDWEYADTWQMGAFYYNNRGNPEAMVEVPGGNEYAWKTKFWNFYVEGNIPGDVKFISQYMRGSTVMGTLLNGVRRTDVDYNAAFILLSKEFGRWRASARVDRFETEDNSFVEIDNNNEDGTSFTAALSAKLGKKETLIFEYLRIDSNRLARETIGFSADQSNDILQLSFRKRF